MPISREEEVATTTKIVRWLAPESVDVRLTNPAGTQTLLTDEITGALGIITTPHHEVHDGESFETSYKSPDGAEIADNGTIEMLFVVGANQPHLTFAFGAVGNWELLFAQVTVDANGAPLEINNMSGDSGNTPTMQVFHTPTNPVVVRTFMDVWSPGGAGGRITTSETRQDLERILGANKLYLIRGTNRSGGAQVGSIHAQWYEEEI